MAFREYWIQIENRLWDVVPNGVDRMAQVRFAAEPDIVEETVYDIECDGRAIAVGTHKREMYVPIESLMLRRYVPPDPALGVEAWSVPLDRRVNAWDLNEPTPAETRGTIPGPVLECNVGESIVVHFRNRDLRHGPDGRLLRNELRTHSLHPHGIAFAPEYDGAYPVSPLDATQDILEDEAFFYRKFGLNEFRYDRGRYKKRSDLVPPGATFVYRWDTNGWASTAGVWLYHDHSVDDHHNVLLGAIGFMIIHDPTDKRDVNVNPDEVGAGTSRFPSGDPNGSIIVDGRFVSPAKRVQCVQLYHEMPGVGMCINGRQFLGNTPTIVAGPDSLIRFGLGAMNGNTFHTFHLHGHRWRRGRGASADTIDTHIFGPAETFLFSVLEGSDEGPPKDYAKGEWHMHCHVLDHMASGMMGSLVIAEGGDEAARLRSGRQIERGHADTDTPKRQPRIVEIQSVSSKDAERVEGDRDETVILEARVRVKTVSVIARAGAFLPSEIQVQSGTEIVFVFEEPGHTVTTTSTAPNGSVEPIEINGGGGAWDEVERNARRAVVVVGPRGGTLNYRCGLHGESMKGKIRII